MSSKRPSEQAFLVLLIIAAVILLAPYIGCHIVTTAPSERELSDTKRSLPPRQARTTDSDNHDLAERISPPQNKEGLDEIETLLQE